MPFFTKKPVTIEAKQWDGTDQSARRILNWVFEKTRSADDHRGVSYSIPDKRFTIRTLEADWQTISPGDYVIRGVKGEFYPCKPEIFEATYDVATAGN